MRDPGCPSRQATHVDAGPISQGGNTNTDSGRGPPSRGRRSALLFAVLRSGPALRVGPPIAMPHVRTLRGGGEESGHQHAPNDDQHDHERSNNYEHAAYGTGDLLAGPPSTSAKASTTLWRRRSLSSTGRVGAGRSFAQRVKAADARRPSDARWPRIRAIRRPVYRVIPEPFGQRSGAPQFLAQRQRRRQVAVRAAGLRPQSIDPSRFGVDYKQAA